MADELLSTFGSQIARLSLLPSSGGRYEVTIDGDLIYSKQATGKHTTNAAIVAAIRQRLEGAGSSAS